MILNYKFRVYDLKRFAGLFFGKPAFNYVNIIIKFFISCITGKVYTARLPFAFSAEISSACNLKCPECATGMGKTMRNKKFMNQMVFKKILSETSRSSFYINLYFQGEPFMNPQIFDFIAEAKRKRFYTVISTNGHFLYEHNNTRLLNSQLDSLLISLDGFSDETYTFYRKNGCFEQVTEGIKNLIWQRKNLGLTYPFVKLQFLVHKKNEHDIYYLKGFAKQLGVDAVELKTMQFYNSSLIGEMMPTKEKYRRYFKDQNGIWQIKKKNKRSCFRLWSQVVITSDGDVAPCCYDKIPGYPVGNIINHNMYDIWKGYKLNYLRQCFLNKKNLPDICNNCYG